LAAFRLRVSTPFFAEAERYSGVRVPDACPSS